MNRRRAKAAAACRSFGARPAHGHFHVPGARLLGGHGCRRRRVLRELPQVPRARPERMAARARHRPGEAPARRTAAVRRGRSEHSLPSARALRRRTCRVGDSRIVARGVDRDGAGSAARRGTARERDGACCLH